MIQNQLRCFCIPIHVAGARRLRLLAPPLTPARGSPLTPNPPARHFVSHLSESKMARPTLEDIPLDAVVHVRLLDSEKEQLREDADMAGMSMSALIRARYFGRPIIANSDAVMVKQLNRIGGLLNKVHTESGGAYSHATAEALRSLSTYIEALTAKRK